MLTLVNKGDYIFDSALDGKRRLVSLWDMIQIYGKDVLETVRLVEAKAQYVKVIKESEPAAIFEKHTTDHIITSLIPMCAICKKLNLVSLQEEVQLFIELLKHARRNASEIYTDLHRLEVKFKCELSNIFFAFIPTSKVQYFEKDARESLFGFLVFIHFPESKSDIRDAGNSIAADLYDAAVFYLMRVVETGLRKFATRLKVRIPKTPLDYAGWKAVVKAIDDKLTAKIPKARGVKQSTALKFKHDLLVDFKAFEVLRNEIMHGRSHHNEQEAIGLFSRVHDFMQQLAKQMPKVPKKNFAPSVSAAANVPQSVKDIAKFYGK